MGQWYEMLAAARTRLDLSQAELAGRAAISLHTLKAYEQGRRHPSVQYLRAVLDALNVDRTERGQILEAAGYAFDWQDLGPDSRDLGFDEASAQAEIDRVAWPCFVTSDFAEVVCANAVVQRLWGVDLRREYTDIHDRNLLSVASNPRFADRCENWDEAVGTLVSMFKGHHRGGEMLDDPSPYFKRVFERFMAGGPKYVARFLRLWETAPPATVQLRWHYPVVWRDPEAGLIDFDCLVTSANLREGWAFNDWIPRDATSWSALERLR